MGKQGRRAARSVMNLCARLFGALGPFWCRFGAQWDPEGVPKSSFWGPSRHKRLQNGVPEGGREQVRKIIENRVTT